MEFEWVPNSYVQYSSPHCIWPTTFCLEYYTQSFLKVSVEVNNCVFHPVLQDDSNGLACLRGPELNILKVKWPDLFTCFGLICIRLTIVFWRRVDAISYSSFWSRCNVLSSKSVKVVRWSSKAVPGLKYNFKWSLKSFKLNIFTCRIWIPHPLNNGQLLFHLFRSWHVKQPLCLVSIAMISILDCFVQN